MWTMPCQLSVIRSRPPFRKAEGVVLLVRHVQVGHPGGLASQRGGDEIDVRGGDGVVAAALGLLEGVGAGGQRQRGVQARVLADDLGGHHQPRLQLADVVGVAVQARLVVGAQPRRSAPGTARGPRPGPTRGGRAAAPRACRRCPAGRRWGGRRRCGRRRWSGWPGPRPACRPCGSCGRARRAVRPRAGAAPRSASGCRPGTRTTGRRRRCCGWHIGRLGSRLPAPSSDSRVGIAVSSDRDEKLCPFEGTMSDELTRLSMPDSTSRRSRSGISGSSTGDRCPRRPRAARSWRPG